MNNEKRDIINELLTIKKGQQVIYHTGFLALDANSFASSFQERSETISIQETAQRLQIAGKVNLVQLKVGCRNFEYIAIGTRQCFSA